MNGFAVERLIDTLKSIDEKLGRIADALEKNVGKDVDLSEVLDEVVAAEKRKPKPVVEEWDDDRIIEQFRAMDVFERGLVLLPSDAVEVTYSCDDKKPNVVGVRVVNKFVGMSHYLEYDYINNRIVM